MKQTFIDYLAEVHAREYTGTDDDMPEAFDIWLGGLDADELIGYADQALEADRSNR